MAYPFTGPLCHRSLLGVDIEGSTRRTDPDKGYLRGSMYDLLGQALDAGGIAESYRDPYMDRGDGVLTPIRPVEQVPKTVLLDTVVPTLAALLAEHNSRHPERRYRLRTVVHAGEVTYDDKGCYGEALDVAFRLLNAEPLKKALGATSAPMVLVVSDELHRCVVRHGYDGIDPNAFTRLLMPRVSGLVRPGWVRVVEAPQSLPQREESQSLPQRSDGRVTRMDDYRRQA